MSHAHYKMNPDEDTVLYGGEIREGMWVLFEPTYLRHYDDPHGELFCEVTKLRTHGQSIGFIGVYADGYMNTHSAADSYAWIVKLASINVIGEPVTAGE